MQIPISPNIGPSVPTDEATIGSCSPLSPDSLLTTQQVADALGLSPRTLANWRTSGRGPLFIGVGRIRYRHSDVLAFVAERRRRSTSEVI